MKRIHKPAWPAADNAVGNAGFVDHSGCVCWMAAYCGDCRHEKYRRKDIARRGRVVGTLIHNGNSRPACSIGPLTIPLIESSFRSFPMAKVSGSTLFAACFAAAMVATVLLPAVTAAANPKYRPAFSPAAKPLTENILDRVSHAHPKARLDNGCRLWQLNAGCVDSLSHERCCQNGPRSRTRPGSPLLDLPQKIT